MKSTIEIILSPYCAGIINEEKNLYIVIKKRATEEVAILQIAATTPDGLKKQRDFLNKHLAEDKDVAPKDKKELELIVALIEHELSLIHI